MSSFLSPPLSDHGGRAGGGGGGGAVRYNGGLLSSNRNVEHRRSFLSALSKLRI